MATWTRFAYLFACWLALLESLLPGKAVIKALRADGEGGP